MKLDHLPGTTIEVDPTKDFSASEFIEPIFMAGGLVLSQVSQLTSLNTHMIQNWIRRGFVSSPVAKKYSKDQFCRIVIINLLKDSLQLEKIQKLISHVNGRLDYDEDNLISDANLYYYFTDIIKDIQNEDGFDLVNLDKKIKEVLKDKDFVIDTYRRVFNVLRIMTIAYVSARLKNWADIAIDSLDILRGG